MTMNRAKENILILIR